MNQRRLRQRIYSPPPLTTRALPRDPYKALKAHQDAILSTGVYYTRLLPFFTVWGAHGGHGLAGKLAVE